VRHRAENAEYSSRFLGTGEADAPGGAWASEIEENARERERSSEADQLSIILLTFHCGG
jgi:hypothetical protein